MASKIIEFIKRKPLVTVVGVIVLIFVANFSVQAVEAYPSVACSPCHNMVPYVEGYQSGDLLSHKHAAANVKCIDCHENSMAEKVNETWLYVTDDFDEELDKRDFGNEMCVKCHKVDDIKAKTNFGQENPHDSHLGDLVCADCHKMHIKSKTKCSQCHNFDFMKKLPAEWEK